MSDRKPYIGAVVQYILGEHDCVAINRQRKTTADVQYLPTKLGEPTKTEENFRLYSGNSVSPGQIVAMIIVAVWSKTCVNGQVFLDGNDSYWALSRNYGANSGNHGSWDWIEEQQ